VAVTARVEAPDGSVFVGTLPFKLTPLQLTLDGGPGRLTVTESASIAESTVVDRNVRIGSVEIGVATARVVSTIGLALALAAAGWVVASARNRPIDDEATRIHRRYASLLVAVHPMPSPAGRPVIDVPEFATLAKLAERYGLLVLHWNRSGVETFVVQDENTTYRYRTGAVDGSPAEAAPATADPVSGRA
jgi:hypothetical protein